MVADIHHWVDGNEQYMKSFEFLLFDLNHYYLLLNCSKQRKMKGYSHIRHILMLVTYSW